MGAPVAAPPVQPQQLAALAAFTTDTAVAARAASDSGSPRGSARRVEDMPDDGAFAATSSQDVDAGESRRLPPRLPDTTCPSLSSSVHLRGRCSDVDACAL